ncbi:MAG: hypothetical protein RL344_55 [Pseudomonadota bacterium]
MTKDYYNDFFFFQFFRTFAEILKSPNRFFAGLPNSRLVSAGSFLLMSYGLFAAITLWSGNFTTQATWVDADLESLSEQEMQIFFRVLKVEPTDISNLELQVISELRRPCLSPLSRRISGTTGSCRLEDIANYFLKVDEPAIAAKLMHSFANHQESQQKFEFIHIALAPLFAVVFAYFFGKIADKKRIAEWSRAKSAHYYYWGAMLFISAIVIASFSVILDSGNLSALSLSALWIPLLPLILFLPLILWAYYTLYALGSKIYKASFGRTLWAFMVSGTITNLLYFALPFVVGRYLFN